MNRTIRRLRAALPPLRTGLLLLLATAACGDRGPAAPERLTPERIRGVWHFSRQAESACVPEWISLRITSVTPILNAPDRLDLLGEWTHSGDDQQRGFSGEATTAGAFSLDLSLNERLEGTMDGRGRAEATARCGNGSTAPMRGVRRP